MTKPLTDNELNHLLKFIGYGRLDTNIWFLGMEEAGGGEENIRTRLKFRHVEDCAEAHNLLGITKHHWGRRIIQPTWRGMCYIMLRLEGKEPSRENIRNYQADKLGRYSGNTLLAELMPIPKPKIKDWDYETLIPQFSSRDEYYKVVMPQRIKYLKQLIRENLPKVVVGYGKSYWEHYKQLFGEDAFESRGQFEISHGQNPFVILTAHLPTRAMNGKFDEVVSIIKGYSVL